MIELTVQFTVLTCSRGGCGITFAVPYWWEQKRREDHTSWNCPNGHGQYFPAESDVEKAQRETRKAQAQINEEQHLRLVAERERDKAIRAKRKIERRVASGVCPCCNRTFENLARHMSNKHKEYGLPPGKDPKQIEGTVQ